MRFSFGFKPALLLVLAMALTPLLMPATASAEPTTIYTSFERCKTNVQSYSVQLQSGVPLDPVPTSDFPQSVTLHFEGGITAEASGFLYPNAATQTYSLRDPNNFYRELPLLYATAQFDIEKYPGYSFTVTAYPCDPTPEPEPVSHTVSGTVVQQGNEMPVAGLTVCLVEAELCTTTDASGSFSIAGVEDGTYTLYTDGDNWKEQYTAVTVEGDDVYVDVVQQKGGGR